MYLNNEKKEVINNYINKSLLNKLLYLGRGLNIVEAFTEFRQTERKAMVLC